MPPRGRGRSGSRAGGGRSSSGPSHSKPAAKGISGSKSKASEGANQSVPCPVSSSSSQPTQVGSDSDSSYDSSINSSHIDSGESDDSHSQSGGFEPNERGKLITSDVQTVGFDPIERGKLLRSIAKYMPCNGIMLLLFETPSGFIVCTFYGAYCHLPDSVDYIWAEFGERLRATKVVFPKGTVSLEDKSCAITDAGVDKQLRDMIIRWHRPGMKLYVGKPEYKRIIESVLGIPCVYCGTCETAMEIMWGLQQQLPREKPKLTKEDRLPMSQGLMRFLWKRGFNVNPKMVNDKIFKAACALFHCDVDDKKNMGLLRDAGLSIRDISGIACKDWDILKLALAVKVIRHPDEELTDFHEILAENVVSKLKGDACKYYGSPLKTCWFRASDVVLSNHHLRIAKNKLLESLVNEARKAYQAKQAQVEKTKPNNPGGGLRRNARLNSGTPDKRPKYSGTSGLRMAIGS